MEESVDRITSLLPSSGLSMVTLTLVTTELASLSVIRTLAEVIFTGEPFSMNTVEYPVPLDIC